MFISDMFSRFLLNFNAGGNRFLLARLGVGVNNDFFSTLFLRTNLLFKIVLLPINSRNFLFFSGGYNRSLLEYFLMIRVYLSKYKCSFLICLVDFC